MKIILLAGLFATSAAIAGTFGLGDPLTPLTPLTPTINYPLSFCGQYPNEDVCKSKSETHTKCIDGTLYHEVEDRVDNYWVQSHNSDGTIIICRRDRE